MFLSPRSAADLLELPLSLSELPAPLANILAFDTSTEGLSLAVCGPAGAITLQAAGGAAASATLLPQALRLLKLAGLRLEELDAVAFGSGPGAFTGLRTACAVAQGLGLGLGLPLLPLDSLLVVAEDARLQQEPASAGDGYFEVAVAMDARMNEVYAAREAQAPPAEPMTGTG
jgi:tRNA threonylcarbamoyladenosine biosynthesis protein TsaB